MSTITKKTGVHSGKTLSKQLQIEEKGKKAKKKRKEKTTFRECEEKVEKRK